MKPALFAIVSAVLFVLGCALALLVLPLALLNLVGLALYQVTKAPLAGLRGIVESAAGRFS